MKEKKTRVFLTGATGVMGMAALNELCRFPERYDIVVLARPSKQNRKKLKSFQEQGVEVIWGDMLDERKIREGLSKADIVLHIGGLVSPQADYFPEQTLKVNIGSMRVIAKTVKEIEEGNPDREVKVVYIGSVSQYGSKLPPHHWGKVGDKLKPALMDAYAVSKIFAERILLESGIKKWVSIRQTGILHPGLLKKADNPVAFHVPITGVLEWITAEDSGSLLERICRDEAGEGFWCNFYNAGGGEKFRLINIEFERGLLKGMSCPAPEKIFETNWFATDNFHGIWFEDSDTLENLLHYRGDSDFESYLAKMKAQLPFYFKLAPLAPSFLIKGFMKGVAKKEGLGPLWIISKGEEEKIKALWGGREAYKALKGWDHIKVPELSRKVLSGVETSSGKKILDTRLSKVKCEKGHSYYDSEALRAGGHSCPYCLFENAHVNLPEGMSVYEGSDG